jgi:hypothetical protein
MAYRTPQQRGIGIAQPGGDTVKVHSPPVHHVVAESAAPSGRSPMGNVPRLSSNQTRAIKVANGFGGVKETTKKALTHPINHLVIGTLTGISLGGALAGISPNLRLNHKAITIPLIVWGTISVATTIIDMQR